WLISNNNLVMKLNSTGGFITSAGITSTPISIAVDSNNYIWIGTTANQILKLTSDGSILNTYNLNQQPSRIFVDKFNNLYITSDLSNIIQLDPSGNILNNININNMQALALAFDIFGYLWAPNSGPTLGLYQIQPTYIIHSMQTDANGNPWLAAPDRLFWYDTNGNLQLTYYLPGGPHHIEIDSSGNIWVIGYNSTQIIELNSTGGYVTAFTLPSTGFLNFTISGNNLWLLQPGQTSTLYNYLMDGTFNVSASIPAWSVDVKTDVSGNVWVTRYDGYLRQYNSQGQFIRDYAIKAGNPSSQAYPVMLAVNSVNDIWISSPFSFSSSNASIVHLHYPITIFPVTFTLDSANNTYVADGNGSIYVIDPQGTINQLYSDYTKFFAGITLNSSGQLIVTAPNSTIPDQRIYIMSTAGNIIKIITGGFVTLPLMVTTDSKNNIWYTNADSNTLVKLDPSGNFLTSAATLALPFNVIYNPVNANIYVSCLNGNAVQQFTSAGQLVATYYTSDSPAGISFDNSNNLWLSLPKNNLIEELTNVYINAPNIRTTYIISSVGLTANSTSPFTNSYAGYQKPSLQSTAITLIIAQQFDGTYYYKSQIFQSESGTIVNLVGYNNYSTSNNYRIASTAGNLTSINATITANDPLLASNLFLPNLI
ncbi:MAG: hypothetical protein ACP5JE_06025, partial [Thermoplasmata archaeon]